MLKFQVFDNGKPAEAFTIRNAHLIGSDNSAMAGDIHFDKGFVLCEKREQGPAALALQTPVGFCGELTIQTCLLPEREEPYLLSIELARHRLMTLYNKLEEWMLFDVDVEHPVTKRVELANKLFIEALCHQGVDDARADKYATDCLIASIDGSEELALTHAELLLNKRITTNSLPKFPIGCGVSLTQSHERVRAGLINNFDFLQLPTPWKSLAPEEGEYRWSRMEGWVQWAKKQSIPLMAGPIISFEPSVLPDWVFLWEHDYDTIRDLLYEHTERVISRYGDSIKLWNVVSGLHINSHFGFSFDQLLDLSRMSTLLAKDTRPNAKVMVEICQPFGEYYAENQKSIPPLMYADLLIQGAVNFDGFSVKLMMGQSQPGQFSRDLMQVSNMLDQFAGFGKPMYLNVCVPSDMVSEMMLVSPDGKKSSDPNCGYWRKPWSQAVQGHWIEAIMHIAMSKPYIEAVVWNEIVDHPDIELPLSGLMTEDLAPKAAFRHISAFRQAMSKGEPMAPTKMGVKRSEAESLPKEMAKRAPKFRAKSNGSGKKSSLQPDE